MLVGRPSVLPINFIHLFIFNNTPHSVEARLVEVQLIAVKCIPEVKLEQQLHPSPIFHRGGGSKRVKLAWFSISLKFELPAFENAARYPNSEQKVQCLMSSPSLAKLGPRTPENSLSVVPHPLKLPGKNMLYRQ